MGKCLPLFKTSFPETLKGFSVPEYGLFGMNNTILVQFSYTRMQ